MSSLIYSVLFICKIKVKVSKKSNRKELRAIAQHDGQIRATLSHPIKIFYVEIANVAIVEK